MEQLQFTVVFVYLTTVIRALLVHICFFLDELGDIKLFPHQQQVIEESSNGNTKRAVADKDIFKPWANATVPYVMDPRIVGK